MVQLLCAAHRWNARTEVQAGDLRGAVRRLTCFSSGTLQPSGSLRACFGSSRQNCEARGSYAFCVKRLIVHQLLITRSARTPLPPKWLRDNKVIGWTSQCFSTALGPTALSNCDTTPIFAISRQCTPPSLRCHGNAWGENALSNCDDEPLRRSGLPALEQFTIHRLHYRKMHNLSALADNSIGDGHDAPVIEGGSEL